VRDRLIESWNDTQQYFREQDPKRVYYLSMEFLMGRSLTNSLYNLEVKGTFSEGLRQLGYSLEDLVEKERDAALGNGGLGRLAACFLDSMASENFPAWGYGIRYQYGMFRQEMHDGFQHENPDYWLNFGNPWEIERPNIAYPIKFYGHVSTVDVDNHQVFKWDSGEEVTAVAYDTPIPGWNTPNTINLSLWSRSRRESSTSRVSTPATTCRRFWRNKERRPSARCCTRTTARTKEGVTFEAAVLHGERDAAGYHPAVPRDARRVVRRVPGKSGAAAQRHAPHDRGS
jgi:glycogen/starch/alpha-glucan phosphorylase-like protein